jgi:hypothetical protein
MAKILRFWWRCLAHAWRGSFSLANAWQGLWGTLLLWAFGYWREIPVTIPDKVDSYAVIFLVASLGTTWVGVFLFQFATAPAKLYWAEHTRANRLSEELSTLKNRDVSSSGANWTVYELFQHIDPDFLDNNRWEKVGDELRDALSTGRLCMWGRLKETDSGSWVGPRAALKPIEKTYWYNAYFTYFFFHEQTSDGVHCYADRKTGRPAYTSTTAPARELFFKQIRTLPSPSTPSSPAWRKLAGSELLRRLRQDRCCMILYGLRMLGAAPIQRAILPPQPRPETFAKPAFRPRQTRWRG